MRDKLFKTGGSDVGKARGLCDVEMGLVWGRGDISKETGNLSWCHLLGRTMGNRGVMKGGHGGCCCSLGNGLRRAWIGCWCFMGMKNIHSGSGWRGIWVRVEKVGVDVSGRGECWIVPWIMRVTEMSRNGCVGVSGYLGGRNVGCCDRIVSL